jgi:putative transcriptional regulator
MSIVKHPTDELLLAYAAGTLDPGEHIAMATHLLPCRQCRAFVDAMEGAGGSLLGDLAPTAMSEGALSRIEALLDAPMPEPAPPVAANARLGAVDGLPGYVRRLPAAAWRWVAPGLHIQRLTPPADSPTRVFLLKAKPGMRLLPHGHNGVELTCVLSGSFSHDGERFAPGDFDCGDAGIEHDIAIGAEGECICLVAMRGKLQLRGFAGRLIQPLIAI